MTPTLQIARLQAEIGACQGCGACLLTCPTNAIRPGAHAALVVLDACTGCGDCVEICPVDVIDLVAVGLHRVGPATEDGR